MERATRLLTRCSLSPGCCSLFPLARQIEDVITRLSSDLKNLEKDADEFRIKHNIQMSGESERGQQQKEQGGDSSAAQREGGSGVLA